MRFPEVHHPLDRVHTLSRRMEGENLRQFSDFSSPLLPNRAHTHAYDFSVDSIPLDFPDLALKIKERHTL